MYLETPNVIIRYLSSLALAGACAVVLTGCPGSTGGGQACNPPAALCGDECVPLTTAANCGGRNVSCGTDVCTNGVCECAGTTCSQGASCVGGVCICPGGQTVCGVGADAACTNLLIDLAHCGGCGNQCEATQSCIAGTCNA